MLMISWLAACGGGGGSGSTATSDGSTTTAGSGAASTVVTGVSTSNAPYAAVDAAHYAASRFLEHTTFGPSPKSVQKLMAMGQAAWLDEQFGQAPSQIDAGSVQVIDINDSENFHFAPSRFYDLTVSAPDQLRLRVSWALSQLFVVSGESLASSYGLSEYFNMLQRNAFGSFADLLRAVTTHSSMGFYLDNASNAAPNPINGTTPNENYARELMQLFTIGLVELNLDGTVKRDSSGKTIPTFSQAEVEETARALSGWFYGRFSLDNPASDFAGFGVPMYEVWSNRHDYGPKQIIGGKVIPAGGNASSDLDMVIQTLLAHPNTAPFVSHKLIQHLVTGDPTPAYVARIATVFRSSGGDLKAVVRAIITDPDARRADAVGVASPQRGKIKEPVLTLTQVMRAFECLRFPRPNDLGGVWMPGQTPFRASTVFNFYPPNHQIPGTALVAPEHRLVNSNTLQSRAGLITYRAKLLDAGATWLSSGCDLQTFDAAMIAGPDAAVELISKRLFRGAMSTNVRDLLMLGALKRNWGQETRIYDAIGLATITPSFAVIK